MCWLAQVSRAGYYRAWQEQEPDSEEMDLRDAIQKIAVAHRRYGYRRVTAELRRQGRPVNHKRVARLMRDDNLLALRRPVFRPPTTDSRHGLRVYLNLAARLQLTGPNQLWRADITYLRLRREFVYLAVVLDAWSRKVIGWSLSRSLQSDLALRALGQALEARQPPAGCVHHSDRGVQYACQEYVRWLTERGLLISMSRAGNPYDNAACESFLRTLKAEEVDGTAYLDLEDIEQRIAVFLDDYYNRQRLHSALGYRTPEQYERQAPAGLPQAAGMEFFEA
jgi:transposase InsO family protein